MTKLSFAPRTRCWRSRSVESSKKVGLVLPAWFWARVALGRADWCFLLFLSCCWCKIPRVHHGLLSSLNHSPSWKYRVGESVYYCAAETDIKWMWGWPVLKPDRFPPLFLCAAACASSTTSFSSGWQRRRRSAGPSWPPPRLRRPALSPRWRRRSKTCSQPSHRNLAWTWNGPRSECYL